MNVLELTCAAGFVSGLRGINQGTLILLIIVITIIFRIICCAMIDKKAEIILAYKGYREEDRKIYYAVNNLAYFITFFFGVLTGVLATFLYVMALPNMAEGE